MAEAREPGTRPTLLVAVEPGARTRIAEANTPISCSMKDGSAITRPSRRPGVTGVAYAGSNSTQLGPLARSET